MIYWDLLIILMGHVLIESINFRCPFFYMREATFIALLCAKNGWRVLFYSCYKDKSTDLPSLTNIGVLLVIIISGVTGVPYSKRAAKIVLRLLINLNWLT